MAGLARKIFPANGDTNVDNGWPLVCYRRDYDTPQRMIRLRGGQKVLLSACYDVFGIAEDLRAIHKDMSANKRLMEEIASGRRIPMPWDMMAFFTRAANVTTRTMAVSGHALAPIHRRAVANQKRLKLGR